MRAGNGTPRVNDEEKAKIAYYADLPQRPVRQAMCQKVRCEGDKLHRKAGVSFGSSADGASIGGKMAAASARTYAVAAAVRRAKAAGPQGRGCEQGKPRLGDFGGSPPATQEAAMKVMTSGQPEGQWRSQA